ncbi:MAG: hypothetical protein A2855_02540 [Candidatus Liptonbacteria bacterium RIFCSPHIGHO2_01_FULL_57_28]|uniref:UPF0102 protein A2855_02540 n=1 Tax=Candidatus Liptonbacteria bacterium RIFCSPHIGHO2_01_FULL_57_28 TaxID=1798647 RepID=A0A1G2C7Y1_9BACT|nr:MAG: hypothetical protein A2855_02540 [Candidatus Liptonbacteria bacterium RIFCSPHIGHO2_01_FULL_57_28]
MDNIGAKGEDIAARYLTKRGYQILRRNYWTKFGEIDLICKDPTGTLIFIEVKTLVSDLGTIDRLSPEDNMSRWKLHKLQRICQFFANRYTTLVERNGWQIDLIAITIDQGTSKLKHYRNIY